MITSANAIPISLLQISYAYESFRRFLHSENTRSDAFTSIILHYIFHWDVLTIALDKSILVLYEIF